MFDTSDTMRVHKRPLWQHDFTTLDSFLSGSYRRSTMIAPLAQADVDIFVVLDSSGIILCEVDHLHRTSHSLGKLHQCSIRR